MPYGKGKRFNRAGSGSSSQTSASCSSKSNQRTPQSTTFLLLQRAPQALSPITSSTTNLKLISTGRRQACVHTTPHKQQASIQWPSAITRISAQHTLKDHKLLEVQTLLQTIRIKRPPGTLQPSSLVLDELQLADAERGAAHIKASILPSLRVSNRRSCRCRK